MDPPCELPQPGTSGAHKEEVPLRRMRTKGPNLSYPMSSEPLPAPDAPMDHGHDVEPCVVNPLQQLQLVDLQLQLVNLKRKM